MKRERQAKAETRRQGQEHCLGGGVARVLHGRLLTWLSIGRNEACRWKWTEWAVEARETRFRHTEKSGTEEHGERTGSTGGCSAAH